MPVRIIICKSRRAGLSTGVEALIFDDVTSHPESDALIIGNQINPSENVLGMCTTFWKYLPKAVKFTTSQGTTIWPVKPELHSKYNNIPSGNRLEFAPPLNSRIFIASAKSIDAYLSYGFQNAHFTEAGYYDDGYDLMRSLGSTLSTDAHSAQYIESTPNGQTGKGAFFYEQCLDARDRKLTQFGETRLVFVPWHEMIRSFAIEFDSISKRSAFERQLKPEEIDIMKRYPHVRLEQIFWRRMKMAQAPFNRDETIFDQEYPSDLATAFLLSGTSVFTRTAIKRLQANVREPVWQGDVYWGDGDVKNEHLPIYDTIRRPHFLTRGQAETAGFKSHVTERTFNNLNVWRWPEKDETIVIGADIGVGNPLTKDGDYSTICVMVLNEDPFKRDELIMTWRGKLNTIGFGEVCAALAWGIRYQVGPKALAPKLVPEWTGPGSATCTYIDEKHLYEVDKYRMPGVTGMPKSKHIGWESNPKTKPYAVNMMARVVEKDYVDIPSEEVVLQMSCYRQKDNLGDQGSYGGAGGHDDFVSSFQIANAVCRLEAQTIPGNFDVGEIDMDDVTQDDGSLGPFDELAPINPGESFGEYEDDDTEEGLYWGT